MNYNSVVLLVYCLGVTLAYNSTREKRQGKKKFAFSVSVVSCWYITWRKFLRIFQKYKKTLEFLNISLNSQSKGLSRMEHILLNSMYHAAHLKS